MSAKKNTRVDVAPPKEQTTEVVATVSDNEAYQLLNRLLATPKNDGVGTDLQAHSQFSSGKYVTRATEANTLSRLETLEHQLMVQLERLDVLSEVFEGKSSSADEINTKAEDLQSGYSALYIAAMHAIRRKTRPVETAIMSLIAFLAEAGQKAKGQYIWILNAPIEVFKEPDFAQQFGTISNRELHFKDTAAIWVTGMNASTQDSFTGLADQAQTHWALALVNADIFQNGMIDRRLRLDLQAREGKSGGQIQKMNADAPNCLNEYRSNNPSAQHAVVCAGPIRVRKADDEFGEIEDVTILLSYVLGGKLHHVSSVNEKTSAATNIRRLTDEFTVKTGYLNFFDEEKRELASPQVISFDRALDSLNRQHIVSVTVSQRSAKDKDEGLCRASLTGYRTASDSKDDKNDMHVMLVECMMERYLIQYKREAEGTSEDDIESFAQSLLEDLKYLESKDTKDGKPLKDIKVKVEFDANGKAFIEVSYTHRKGVSDLKIVRKPTYTFKPRR